MQLHKLAAAAQSVSSRPPPNRPVAQPATATAPSHPSTPPPHLHTAVPPLQRPRLLLEFGNAPRLGSRRRALRRQGLPLPGSRSLQSINLVEQALPAPQHLHWHKCTVHAGFECRQWRQSSSLASMCRHYVSSQQAFQTISCQWMVVVVSVVRVATAAGF